MHCSLSIFNAFLQCKNIKSNHLKREKYAASYGSTLVTISKHFTRFDIVVPQLQALIYNMFYFHLTIIPKKQPMFAKAVRTAKNESHNDVNGSKLITDISCN